MKIFNTYQNIPEDFKDAVVAIGNFDGVHRGHQMLLDTVKTRAKESGKKPAILTFEPHPHSLFQPDNPPARLTPYALKMQRLEEEGIEAVFVIDFNWDFASLSAQDFIDKVLIKGLGASHIVVGADFCFGQLRKGTPDMIKASGLPTTILDKISDNEGEIFSSSRIRQAIRHGDIAAANDILGWNWCMSGEVIKGDQRGRELGYPTANFELGDTIHPAYGVYATLAGLEGEAEWHMAATNIGIRPMFEREVAQIETCIFNFDQEIYGRTLYVRPVKRLRGEAKFGSLDDLIRQMALDCQQAEEILTPLIKQEKSA